MDSEIILAHIKVDDALLGGFQHVHKQIEVVISDATVRKSQPLQGSVALELAQDRLHSIFGVKTMVSELKLV